MIIIQGGTVLTVDPADTLVFSLYVSAIALVVPLVAFPLGRLVRR